MIGEHAVKTTDMRRAAVQYDDRLVPLFQQRFGKIDTVQHRIAIRRKQHAVQSAGQQFVVKVGQNFSLWQNNDLATVPRLLVKHLINASQHFDEVVVKENGFEH